MERSHCLVWGMALVIGGCSLGNIQLKSAFWHPWSSTQTGDPLSPPINQRSSGPFPEISISAVDLQNSETSSPENEGPSEPGKSQKISSPPPEKPAILVPELPPQDNDQAIVTYKSKIEETRHLLRTVNESRLTKEQKDTFISVQSFLDKAQEAFSQDDMSMALNLAEKAHTLTKEIVHSSPKP